MFSRTLFPNRMHQSGWKIIHCRAEHRRLLSPPFTSSEKTGLRPKMSALTLPAFKSGGILVCLATFVKRVRPVRVIKAQPYLNVTASPST